MNIYVGNLAYSSTEDGLRELFSQYGEVASVKLITDKFTGKPRGFAFVEMPNDQEAKQAIEELNDTQFESRTISVKESQPREKRPERRRF